MPSAGRSLTGMLILRLTSQVFTFAVLIILTRMLGPADYGVYSFMISCMWFASLFNIHGLNDVVVREILTQPENREKIYRSGLALKLILGVTGYIITEAIILKFNLFPFPFWVSLTFGLTLFTSFTLGSVRMIWDVPYQVDFRMVSASVINLVVKGLFFTLIVGFIGWHALQNQNFVMGSLSQLLSTGVIRGGVITIITLLIISEVTGLFVQLGVNRRYRYSMQPMWDREAIRNLIHEVWPMAISGAILLMVGRVNILMLRWFLSDHEVGLFAAPMQLIEALYIVPTVIMATTLPIFSKSFRDGMAAFKQTLRVIFKLMLLISVTIAGIVSFHSQEIIQLLFGTAFEASSMVMSIYIWIIPMVFGASVVHVAVIAAGRQRWLMVTYALHLLYIFGLNLYLIPRYGISGAATGYVISYGLFFISMLFIPKIGYMIRIWMVTGLLPITVSILLGWGTAQLNIGLWASVIVIPVLLGGVLYFSGWFSRDDIAISKRLIGSRGGSG